MANNSISKNQANSKLRFINPYNFVPFGRGCERKDITEYLPNPGEGLTGYLDCKLTPLTQLFIPNTSNDHALRADSKMKSYDFFSYTDLSVEVAPVKPQEPVIPGSEIRGAVRSVFEAAFNGCVSSVDADRVLAHRSLEYKGCGVLKKEGDYWIIIPCERYKVTKSGEWTEGDFALFQLDEKDHTASPKKNYTDKSRLRKGYIHEAERPNGDGINYFAFIPNRTNRECIKVRPEQIEYLKEVLKQYRGPKINKMLNGANKEWYPNYKINGKAIPVFYSQAKDGSAIYLSPACKGREVFRKKIRDLLGGGANGYMPCKDRDKLCQACSLFGMVQEGKGQSVGSRIRFGDAKIIDSRSSEQICIQNNGKDTLLPVLAEPKPSAMEFYTQQPSECRDNTSRYWTYGQYRCKVGNKTQYIDLPGDKPLLRGRKFYWHYSRKLEENKKSIVNTEMQSHVRLLRSTDETPHFRFKVYFENISKDELARLKWALDLGCSAEVGKEGPAYAHKLGRGKPLGLGSVWIQIERVFLRTVDEQGVWKLEENKDPLQYDTSSVPKDLQCMLRWQKEQDNKLYRYPLGESRGHKATYSWFAGNRKGMKYAKLLPTPQQELGKDESKHLYEPSK